MRETSRPRSRRVPWKDGGGRLGWWCLWLGLTTLSCKEGSDGPPTPSPEPDPVEFRNRAHRAAYDRLLPLAQSALATADPVAALQRGLANPGPPPFSASRHAEVQSKYEAAWLEAADIEGEALEPTEAMMLTAVRFALNRIHDARGSHDPARRSLAWSIAEVRRFVSSLEWALAGAQCSDCAAALARLGEEVRAAAKSLGGTSAPTLAAAETDLDALIRQIQGLADRDPASASALRNAAVKTATHLQEVRAWVRAWSEQLPTQPTTTWETPLAPLRGQALARLPDRLGSQVLRRRLDVEEGVTFTAEHAFRRLGLALGRLRAMAETVGPSEDQDASAVTEARCQAILDRVVAFAERHPQLGTRNVDCSRLLTFWGPRARTDAELSFDVVRWGVLEPARLARLRDEAPVLALVTGRIAAESHALTATLAILMGMNDRPGASLAIRRATDAACLAATALWIHGELGTDDALTERLQRECAGRLPTEWIADAEARPRASLAGMGLVHMGTGPAEVVALERYWWAPLGLIERLASPAQVEAPPTPVDVKVEPIVPEPKKPPEPERRP